MNVLFAPEKISYRIYFVYDRRYDEETFKVHCKIIAD